MEAKTSAAKRSSNDKWDSANMAYQTVKVKKTLLAQFRETCAARGDKVNSVLRKAMEDYVGSSNEKKEGGEQNAD